MTSLGKEEYLADLQFVIEEIEGLRRAIEDSALDNSTLRKMATNLKILLIEGKISVIGRFINESFVIEGPNFKHAFEICREGGVDTYVVTPRKIKSAPTNVSLCIADRRQYGRLEKVANGANVCWKYSQYIKQEAVFLRGKTATRKDIILFVRNKLGAAHFDSNIGKEYSLLKEVSSYWSVENPFDQSPRISMGLNAVKRINSDLNLNLKIDAVLMELLSIAAGVVDSPSYRKLRNTFEIKKPTKRTP